jgi:hypothetical protein
MTRSVLRGDTRWGRFLSAEVDAVLIQRLLINFNMKSYIRRFRNISGFTLGTSLGTLIECDFENILRNIETLETLVMLDNNEEQEANDLLIADQTSLVWAFIGLSRALSEAGCVEKVTKSSLTSGACVINRYFARLDAKDEVEDEPVIPDELEIPPDVITAIFDTADE